MWATTRLRRGWAACCRLVWCAPDAAAAPRSALGVLGFRRPTRRRAADAPRPQFGVIVLTTSAGIMDHEEARRKKTGGKVRSPTSSRALCGGCARTRAPRLLARCAACTTPQRLHDSRGALACPLAAPLSLRSEAHASRQAHLPRLARRGACADAPTSACSGWLLLCAGYTRCAVLLRVLTRALAPCLDRSWASCTERAAAAGELRAGARLPRSPPRCRLQRRAANRPSRDAGCLAQPRTVARRCQWN